MAFIRPRCFFRHDESMTTHFNSFQYYSAEVAAALKERMGDDYGFMPKTSESCLFFGISLVSGRYCASDFSADPEICSMGVLLSFLEMLIVLHAAPAAAPTETVRFKSLFAEVVVINLVRKVLASVHIVGGRGRTDA